MRNFNKKRIWRSILESWPVLLVLGMLVLFFAWSVIGFLGKMAGAVENRQLVESKIVELEDQKRKLSYDIDKLNTDAGIEASIREKFGLAREGEGQIIIIEDSKEPESPESSSSGFFSFFTRWFK